MKEIFLQYGLPPVGFIWPILIGLLLWASVFLRRLFIGAGIVGMVLSSMKVLGMLVFIPFAATVTGWTPGVGKPAAIVVATGGAYRDSRGEWWGSTETTLRVARGVELHTGTAIPLIIAGGTPFKDGRPEAEVALKQFGLTATAAGPIRIDTRSADSYDTARRIATMLGADAANGVVLVSDALHLPRLAAAFRAAGVPVVGGAAVRAPGSIALSDLIPSMRGIGFNRAVTREVVAIGYYLYEGQFRWRHLFGAN